MFETRVMRKVTRRIVPFIMVLYLIAFIDRVNIGFASLTMNAGIETTNSIGNVGGFVAPSMIGWIKDTTGRFEGDFYFVAELLVVSAAVTLILSRTGRRGAHAKTSATLKYRMENDDA